MSATIAIKVDMRLLSASVRKTRNKKLPVAIVSGQRFQCHSRCCR